jgi:hypothetical protein
MVRTQIGLLVAGIIALAGCGGGSGGTPKHVVKGKISNGGSILEVKQLPSKAGGNLKLWLIDTDQSKILDVYDADIDFATGAFVIGGGDGRGIPPGKYKVCVEWKDDYPGGPDKLKGRFSEENSKLVREIPPPSGELIIDVSKDQ